MIISILAAMSDDRVIGREGKLPWHVPADLARFKTLTMYHAVIMGRRTYESIGHPLQGRKNIVVSRSGAEIEGCQVVRSLKEAIGSVSGDDEIFIIGGADLFREAFPVSQRIYLTLIHGSYRGDVYFPDIPKSFMEVYREELQENAPPLTFLVYEKGERLETAIDAEGLRRKGLEALQRNLYYLARTCFEQALTSRDDPEVSAYLAFCLAKCGSDRQKALQIAEKAYQEEPDRLSIRLNLGRVQMMAGLKEKGLETLRTGVKLGGGREFTNELSRWGSRKPPPIKSLPRSHPLNKYLGKLLYRLGLR